MQMTLPITDTRASFRPLCAEIVSMFRALNDEDWLRPTVAGAWRVRDVAAHMLDTALRRLSFHRDRLMPAGKPPATDRDLAALVNELNGSWVQVAGRFSPRVLTDLYSVASASLAGFFESLDLHSPARFPVSWAGQTESPQWLDTGREFTEIWHHGSQIREAVKLGPFSDPSWLRAVLEIAMHALPAAYRGETWPAGSSLVLSVNGPSGGAWTLTHGGGVWSIEEGTRPDATAKVTLSGETAWRLLFSGRGRQSFASLVMIEGDRDLARPFLSARAIVI